MTTLFYTPGACSLADHIALAEAGLPYDLVKVDLRAKTTEDGRDFTTINPKGYVPALALDDGGVLTENIAVLSWIAETGGALMPAGGLPRLRVLETVAYVSTELHKNFKPFFNPKASEAEKDEAKAMLAKRFKIVEEMIGGGSGGGGFVVGGALSVADCYLFVILLWAAKNGIDVGATLDTYRETLKARPGFQRALQEEGLA